MSDDILVFGCNQQEHDIRLEACLQCIRDRNLTLNRAKCVLGVKTIEFYGHVFNAEGISPDPRKVESLKSAESPKTFEELSSFLGLATYCARFIPALATMTDPLRDLLKDKATWTWTEVHETAIENIRDSISHACSMAYFDITKKTELLVDASPVGLGAMLVQYDSDGKGSVVALASKSLKPVEQRYSQTEREALAVYWGIVHFHLYLYGSSFQVVTDHKPLVPLFNRPMSKPPLRIERWLLKLQEYEFELTYQQGKFNPADYMSRHPIMMTQDDHAEKMTEEFVNMITHHSVPKTLTVHDIREATEKDGSLQRCMVAIETNNWHKFRTQALDDDKPEVESLYKVRADLSVNIEEGIILRDHRIVVLTALRHEVVKIAHEGHQGVVKTKQLLREKVWFPGIDKLVESCPELLSLSGT
jgi:hypothetical protein